jgi:hypothetical protein
MSKRILCLAAALVLIVVWAAGPGSAKDASAQAPKAAEHCNAIAIDLTDPALVAKLQNTRDARPVSDVSIEVKGEGADRTRIASQEFESTPEDTPAPAPTPAPVKTTVTCTSGTCLGLNCAVVGCDPTTLNGQTACTPCDCVPVPPAITCATGSCTCTKTTVTAPATPVTPTTPSGSEL